MLKKIGTSELCIGMYVHGLGRGWLEHPFARSRFMIKDLQTIQKIASAGIREVTVDTDKGLDPDDFFSTHEEPEAERVCAPTTRTGQVPVAEEVGRAKVLFREATSIIRNMMIDARLGRQVEVQTLEPLAERIVQSTLRSRHALSGITRIKSKDEYTFMHSVSVAGLLTTFGLELGLDHDTVHQMAVGGMVHDIGKTLVPDPILNKPGKLDDDEFQIMKRHVDFSGELLADQAEFSQVAVDITMQHHERMNAKGYPLGLRGEQISLIGQMAAIVDVYDALTSVRVYKTAWEPSITLKQILEWSPQQFNADLVQRFIKCLGIYPVGSLVELESGRVGVVMEQGRDILRPLLRIVYHAKRKSYQQVLDLDLAKETAERIVSVRSPTDFGLDLSLFI